MPFVNVSNADTNVAATFLGFGTLASGQRSVTVIRASYRAPVPLTPDGGGVEWKSGELVVR